MKEIDNVEKTMLNDIPVFGDADIISKEDIMSNQDKIKWLAFHYTQESYEGSGQMLVALTDGTFCFHDMSHCSCYGPMEKFDISQPFYTRDELSQLVDKDLNGKPIDPAEWNWENLNGMWTAAKAAVIYETQVAKQKADLLVTVCQSPEIEMF